VFQLKNYQIQDLIINIPVSVDCEFEDILS